uniref:Uncharacterized protein n=1 Tax=Anguilla anguilla TaxID=7936 RepID=A0A0E9P8F2_ANGAN
MCLTDPLSIRLRAAITEINQLSAYQVFFLLLYWK